jgi:hypothetical protein
MKKILIKSLKFLTAWSGPAFMLYSGILFERHFEFGKETATGTYTVLINNHGVFRYITEEQHLYQRLFLGLAVVWGIGLLILIYITKFRKQHE